MAVARAPGGSYYGLARVRSCAREASCFFQIPMILPDLFRFQSPMVLLDLFRSVRFSSDSPILFRRVVFFSFFYTGFFSLAESDLWNLFF